MTLTDTFQTTSKELDAGQGSAGDVNIKTSGSVTIAGKANEFISGISSAFNGKKGNAGNISIDSGSLSLTDGAIRGCFKSQSKLKITLIA